MQSRTAPGRALTLHVDNAQFPLTDATTSFRNNIIAEATWSTGLSWAVSATLSRLRLTAPPAPQPCEMLPAGYQIVLGGYLDAADGTICANSDQYQLGVTLRDSNGRLATHTSDVCVLVERTYPALPLPPKNSAYPARDTSRPEFQA